MSEFDEYIRQGEPGRREKAAAWQTAIGLQDVDGLKPSKYLIDTAKKHIEGDITIDDVKSMLNSYYASKGPETRLSISAQKKRIKFRQELRNFLKKRHSLLLRLNFYEYIADCSKACSKCSIRRFKVQKFAL